MEYKNLKAATAICKQIDELNEVLSQLHDARFPVVGIVVGCSTVFKVEGNLSTDVDVDNPFKIAANNFVSKIQDLHQSEINRLLRELDKL